MRTKVFRTIAFLLGSLFVLHGVFIAIVGEPTGNSGIGTVITSVGLGAIFIFYSITGYSSIYKYFKQRSAK
jgi:hypothetical protein